MGDVLSSSMRRKSFRITENKESATEKNKTSQELEAKTG